MGTWTLREAFGRKWSPIPRLSRPAQRLRLPTRQQSFCNAWRQAGRSIVEVGKTQPSAYEPTRDANPTALPPLLLCQFFAFSMAHSLSPVVLNQRTFCFISISKSIRCFGFIGSLFPCGLTLWPHVLCPFP